MLKPGSNALSQGGSSHVETGGVGITGVGGLGRGSGKVGSSIGGIVEREPSGCSSHPPMSLASSATATASATRSSATVAMAICPAGVASSSAFLPPHRGLLPRVVASLLPDMVFLVGLKSV